MTRYVWVAYGHRPIYHLRADERGEPLCGGLRRQTIREPDGTERCLVCSRLALVPSRSLEAVGRGDRAGIDGEGGS